MKLVNLIEEDFVNYREPGMFLGFPYCSGKCNELAGKIVCQNQDLQKANLIDIPVHEIVSRYMRNPITKCLICGGLEPFDSFDELSQLIFEFHLVTHDPVIIYTGYYLYEIKDKLMELCIHDPDILIKFGRYEPDQKPHYDKLLGVYLSSDDQYAEWSDKVYFQAASMCIIN